VFLAGYPSELAVSVAKSTGPGGMTQHDLAAFGSGCWAGVIGDPPRFFPSSYDPDLHFLLEFDPDKGRVPTIRLQRCWPVVSGKEDAASLGSSPSLSRNKDKLAAN
jgi:hypothetical protein